MTAVMTPEPQSEAALVEAVRSGDAAALATMFRRYATVVYRIAFRLTANAADGEDVLQDVFVGLPGALRSFDHAGSFEGWLKRVTVRTCLMRLRATTRKREVGLDSVMDSLEATSSRSDDHESLETAIAKLPAPLRQVFVLHEVEGYSHQETATLLGITLGASEVRLFRARRALRELLGDSP